MQFRRVGSSGLNFSVIAYGNFLTHGDKVDIDLARECVHSALNQGITTFDTADSYASGAAEIVLGEALRDVPRDSVEVCTKVFFPLDPDPLLPNQRGLSRKHVMESIDGSLRRLHMDYVDLYVAHRFDVETPLEEAMQAFADVVRAGKALYIGISEWPAEQISAACKIAQELSTPLIANQVQYSMLWREPEDEVGPVCEQAGIGLWAWSPLAQGVLTGKYLPGKQPPPGSRAVDGGRGAHLISKWLTGDVLTRVQQLGILAAELDLSLTHLALAWVLARRNISGVVVGGSSPAQIIENAKAADFVIPPEALAQIDEILRESPSPRG